MANGKCKEKPGNMKSGLDAKPLFLEERLLSECSILEPSFSNLTGLLQVNNTSGSFLPMHNKAGMLLTFIAAELILRWRKR